MHILANLKSSDKRNGDAEWLRAAAESHTQGFPYLSFLSISL